MRLGFRKPEKPEKPRRYVIAYGKPRRGKRGTPPGTEWALVETDCRRCIERVAKKVARNRWANGAGFQDGYYDRHQKRFRHPE